MKKVYLSMIVLLFVFLVPLNANAESNYKACVGGNLDLSVKCSEDDNFEFKCDDDECMSSTYKGYSSISVGTYVNYSKSYSLCFSLSGTHNVNVLKNGSEFETITVTVYEKHDFDDGTVKKKATCDNDGEIEYLCQNCGNKKTETIKSTGHEYEESETVNPTCTRFGKIIYICKNCGKNKTENINATGHTYVENSIVNPTCEEDGKITYVCRNCNKSKYEVVKATGHEYKEERVEPVCGNDGCITKTCLKCGHIEKTVIHATEKHNWSEWETFIEPNCTNAGTKIRKCLTCGFRDCGIIAVVSNAHEFGEWEYLTKPTAVKNGEMSRKCKYCTQTERKKCEKLTPTIRLSYSKKTIKKNKSFTLKIKEYTYGDKIKSFKSSNKKIATVSKNGKITGKKKGTAKITVTMKSGVKATCKVTVK